MRGKMYDSISKRILVLGAGISGLSSAVNIQESCQNVNVTIMADAFSPNTTSDGAAGFFEIMPVGKTDPTLLRELAAETYKHLLNLSMSPLASTTRVQQVSGCLTWDSKLEEELNIKDVVSGYRQLSQEEISRVPGAKDGRFFTSLTVDVTCYLKWLTDRFISNGGRLVQRRIHSLEELSGDWDVVVNCVGLGSYTLLQDHKMYPDRGQVFRVHAPWIKHFCVFEPLHHSEGCTSYILPNSDTLVVGGVNQKNCWKKSVDDNDAKGIWARAVNMMPCLKDAKILKIWVGLRPGRETLRLESEVTEFGKEKRVLNIVHNYGHGGSGVSLHWGCATKTATMVSQILLTEDNTERTQRIDKRLPSKL